MSTTKKLPMNIRILIGIIAIPSLLLFCMLIFMLASGEYQGISAFEVVYSFVGLVAGYLAITGKRLF